ncbi:zonular occludens toxin family protein [Undibacterium curvum]|uniref:zonular occludens toxin family protein n=1 Tax=Undibacterium curvum TaxID=2762294 RepID=UPI003D0E4325
MAINAYVGLQGSGKSYEVVSSVILDAVQQGRRVITNVAGINEDLIHEYLVNKRNANIDQLGCIIHVDNERVMQPQFFPDEEKPELDSIVKGGDLVAIDEAWRFWGTDSGKLSHEHMQFFRMHRHYVHPETALACDVVLMTQDITGLHRSVKNVIEFAFKMHKLKSLGFSKLYRVEIYEGWKLNSKTRIDDRQKKYNPEFFPLYQSYTGGAGMEKSIDKRQNIFTNKRFWFVTGLFMIIGPLSWWYVRDFFNPNLASQKKSTPSSHTAVQVANSDASLNSGKNAESPTLKAISESWHIVGEIAHGNERWVVVTNAAGKLRVESPSMFSGSSAALIGDLEGEKVTRWSGSQPTQNQISGGMPK